MDTTIVDRPIPLAPAGLSFPSGLPAAALNFPASSSTSVPTQLAPVPAAPGPASPERSTRSSAAAQQQKTAQKQEQDDSPAERRQSKEERDQLRQVKAERRARRGDYQNTDKQEKLMTSLMEMLVDKPDDAPQAPPTPTPTSPSHSVVPSFIAEDPLSSDPDSSSDDDAYGRPKPPRPPRYDSHGLLRPRPSYYYDAGFDPATGGAKKLGRRGGMKGIPVFEPTMKEFEGEGGFYGYVKRIEKYGMRSGVVKVIPPKEWTDALPSTSAPLRDIRLREPIEQLILGSQGLYRVTNVAKTRIWNPAQWKEMADSKKWEAPDFKAEAQKGDRSERPTGKRPRNRKDSDEEEDGDDEEEEKRPARQAPKGRVKLGRGGGRAGTSGMRAGFLHKGKGKAKEEDSEVDELEGDDAPTHDDTPIQQATPPDTTTDAEMVDAPATTDEPIASTSAAAVPIPDEMPLPHPSHLRPVLAEPDTELAAAAGPTPKTPIKAKKDAKDGDVEDKEKEKPTPRLTRAQIAAAAAAEAAKPKPKGKGKAKASKSAPSAAPSATDSPSGTPKSSAPRPKRPTNLQRAEPTDAEWQAFMEKFEELPHGMKRDEYTVEMMRDVERRYWRTLTFGEAPMYGADMNGSIFSDKTKAWNVAHLGDLLPRLAPPSCQIPGVVSPYLYFGMWRATFAWHVEDADLYSINYIHFGAPKFWYSVPQEQSERFERVMEGFFPTDRSKCSQFLRHKAFLASPRVLANSGITLNRVAQLPGEFILTYPKGYHSGFNLGFNCAESINFATERWLPLGKVAKSCYCIGDSVNIDVDTWLYEAAKAEAEARGETFPPPRTLPPTPPPGPHPRSGRHASPPLGTAPSGSVPQKRRRQSEQQAQPQRQLAPAPKPGWDYVPVIPGQEKKQEGPLPSKRKSRGSFVKLGMEVTPDHDYDQPQNHQHQFQLQPQQQLAPKQKKVKGETAPQQQQQRPPLSSHGSATSKKPSMGLGLVGATPQPSEKQREPFVCALCPDMSSDGLVKIGEPGVKHKKGLSAHRVCVMFTPATWIEIDPATNEEIVRGYAGIEKARWKLKCQLCPESHGTKVQCTKGKCIKAVHVTCAMHVGSGFFLDATVPGEPGHSVSLLDQARAEMDPTSPQKSKVSIPQRTSPSMPAAALPVPAAEVDDSIKLHVLCRAHNPDFKLQEAARKAKELETRVAELKPQTRLRVRTPGGVFEVSFIESYPAKESVLVTYDDGTRLETKWKNITWEDVGEARKLKQQAAAERARVAAESVYVYDGPNIKPSKRARTSYPPAPPPQAFGYPPAPMGYYHPPPPQHTYAAFPPHYAYPPPPPHNGAPMSHASPPMYANYGPPAYPYYPPPPPGAYGYAQPPPPPHVPSPRHQPQSAPNYGPPPPHQGSPSWPAYSPYGTAIPPLYPSPVLGHQQYLHPGPPQHQVRTSIPHHSPGQRMHPSPHPAPLQASPRQAPPLQPIPSPRFQQQQQQQQHNQHRSPSSAHQHRSPSLRDLLSDGGEGGFSQPRAVEQETFPAGMRVGDAIAAALGERQRV